MSIEAKEKFYSALCNKLSVEDDKEAGFSLSHLIKEQEAFLKAIKDYASTSWIQELIKVANILQAEIYHRAEFGEMYREINETNIHIKSKECDKSCCEPRTSTPLTCDKSTCVDIESAVLTQPTEFILPCAKHAKIE